jgi:hypothetical protein
LKYLSGKCKKVLFTLSLTHVDIMQWYNQSLDTVWYHSILPESHYTHYTCGWEIFMDVPSTRALTKWHLQLNFLAKEHIKLHLNEDAHKNMQIMQQIKRVQQKLKIFIHSTAKKN